MYPYALKPKPKTLSSGVGVLGLRGSARRRETKRFMIFYGSGNTKIDACKLGQSWVTFYTFKRT